MPYTTKTMGLNADETKDLLDKLAGDLKPDRRGSLQGNPTRNQIVSV